MVLLARSFKYDFPRPALVMGILNVTPDSFYDGGQFVEPKAAVARGLELISAGAEIIDIGGESSRPRAVSVDEQEELSRVIPVIEELAGQVGVPISIDTIKPGVARAAVQAGASIINDIAANRTDEAMWECAAESAAGYICVHMQGTPATMQVNPVYGNVVGEVREFFYERIERLTRAGVRIEQIIMDPGIGFGKTLEHNLQLLANLSSFTKLERPVLLGASRKSFMHKLLGLQISERLPAGIACAALAINQGAQIIRTHDVSATVQAIRMAEAIVANTAK